MTHSSRHWRLVFTIVCSFVPCAARAQGPTYDTGLPASPGGIVSGLGIAPGSGGNTMGQSPGGGSSVLSGAQTGIFLGGRPGASVPRVPTSIATPTAAAGPTPDQRGIAAPEPIVTPPANVFASLEPGELTILGPPNGMTLDQAIDIAVRENLDLRAKFYEIPQAQADVLNANLRANPIFYADGQLVPYGQYTRNRPGGQTQYDVNVTYPIDVSHKRQARTKFAARAKRVIEAMYQDAVRNRIDDVYGAYVDVLAAMQTVIYMEKSLGVLSEVYDKTKSLVEKDQGTRADLSRVQIQLQYAEVGLIDAKENERSKKRILGTFLNLPAATAENLQVRGSLADTAPSPPSLEELLAIALEIRPDVTAFRLGILSAEANVKLQMANRYSDVYVLYQPYTFQNNQPFGLKSPTSWALGVTVPIPIYNRNQGAILRAKLNVSQSQIELSQYERNAITDVQNGLKEYEVTRRMVEDIKTKVIPNARQVREDTYRLYVGGEVNGIIYLNAQREFNDLAKQYLDTIVRHRKSMLSLNTVVGQRILP